MPITEDGDYVPLSEEEVEQLLTDALIEEFGSDIDLSRSSVFRTLVRIIARASAEEISPTLQEIFEGSFLETAEGVMLDRVVEILGISRISSRRATGVVRFIREEPTHQTFTIPSGTVVQTDGEDPIRFETRRSTNIQLYANFEDNTLSPYIGNLGAFNVTDDSQFVFDGDFALEYDSLDADETIWQERTQRRTHRGKRLSVQVLAPDGSVPRQLFGVADNNNTYYTEVDTTAGGEGEAAHRLFVRSDGVDTQLDEEIITYPLGDYVENDIDWRLEGKIVSTLRDADDNVLSTITATEEFTWLEGGFGFENGSTVNCYWDNYTSYTTSVNIRAMEGGVRGNVGANTLVILPTVPSGVEEVTNPHATGDFNFTDIDGDTYIVGRERETDDQLRERVRNTVGQAGSATIDSIASNIREIEGVESVVVFENTEPTEDAENRPPHSFEPVVLGGNEQDIIDAIYETKAATARDTGGHVGVRVEGKAISEVTGQTYEIEFSRPDPVKIDLIMDVVVDDTYIGNTELRNRIVNYTGGQRADGVTVVGLASGQDVKIDQLRDAIVNDQTGVVGVSSLSVTPATTTDANGLEVVSVGDNEVATADATDSSIIINVTVQ